MSCDLEQIRTRGFTLAALPSLAAVLACLIGSPASAADGAAPRFSGLPPTIWVMGDFNGDRKSDLAVLGTASPKAEGHRLHVQLDALQLPALTNSPAGFRLSVLDLDGDSDRDIVLETAFREPVAIWLNDGTGHFEEGDVDSFRFRLSHDDCGLLNSPERQSPRIQIGECPNRDAVSSRDATPDLKSPNEILIAGREENRSSVHAFVIRTRGPPSLF